MGQEEKVKPVSYQAMRERLYETTDAAVWAKEFCNMFGIYTPEGVVEDGEGLMIGWFANAIEIAKMHAQADKEQVGWVDEFGQLYSLGLRTGLVPGDRAVYILR